MSETLGQLSTWKQPTTQSLLNKVRNITTFQAKQRSKDVSRHLIAAAVTMTSALNQNCFKMPKGERFAIWANENIQDLYGCQEGT